VACVRAWFRACGDLLERAIGRRCLDASDQPDKAIIALLWPGAVQQAGLDDIFIGQPPRRSRSTVQVVACPRFRTRTTSPHGLVGAHLPHGGQPGVQWRQDAFQIDDDDGRHCLVGGLEHIRACRGGGDRAGEYLSRAIRDVCGKRQTIIKFNDSRESYAEIRAVILHARKLALQVIVDYAG
jgi:hypothetical protein